METEGSLLLSHVLATCPYPGPHRFNPCPHIPLREYPSSYYPPIYSWVFQVFCFPQVSPPKHFAHLSSLPYVHMSRPSHSSWFHHPVDIWWAVQIIKLILIYSSELSRCFVPLTPIYFPGHPIFKHPQPTFVPQCERTSFAPAKNNRQMVETCCIKYLITEILSFERQSLYYSSTWMSQRIV